jgi:hypothetical protein
VDRLEFDRVARITNLEVFEVAKKPRVTFLGDLHRRKLRSTFITITNWKVDTRQGTVWLGVALPNRVRTG